MYLHMYLCTYVHTSVPMAVLFRRTVHSKRIRKVSSADFSVNKRSIYFCIQHKQLIKLLSKLKQNKTNQNHGKKSYGYIYVCKYIMFFLESIGACINHESNK